MGFHSGDTLRCCKPLRTAPSPQGGRLHPPPLFSLLLGLLVQLGPLFSLLLLGLLVQLLLLGLLVQLLLLGLLVRLGFLELLMGLSADCQPTEVHCWLQASYQRRARMLQRETMQAATRGSPLTLDRLDRLDALRRCPKPTASC